MKVKATSIAAGDPRTLQLHMHDEVTDADRQQIMKGMNLAMTDFSPLLMLDLSTGHLTPDTRRALERDWPSSRILIAPFEFGWIIHVAEDTEGLPDDLVGVLAFARSRGIDYLKFDADGQRIDLLQYYEDDTNVYGT